MATKVAEMNKAAQEKNALQGQDDELENGQLRVATKEEQDARMTALINGLSHLKLFCKSPPSTLQFSFEDESDCSEDERY